MILSCNINIMTLSLLLGVLPRSVSHCQAPPDPRSRSREREWVPVQAPSQLVRGRMSLSMAVTGRKVVTAYSVM